VTVRYAISRHGMIGPYFINAGNSDSQMISGNFIMPETYVPRNRDFNMMVVRAMLYM
jgi:hypothetical protein